MDTKSLVKRFLKVGVAMEIPRFIAESVSHVIIENWLLVNLGFWIKLNILRKFRFLIELVFSL